MGSAIAVALGAVPGALCRYSVTRWWASRGQEFPAGTLLINLTGAWAMGGVTTGLQRLAAPAPWAELLSVGFLGAYTTFSTYTLETAALLQSQRPLQAYLYGLGSPLLGLGALKLGQWMAAHL